MQGKTDKKKKKKENITYQQLLSRHEITLDNNQLTISNKQLKSSK